jgi:uncharacterized protein (DUF58 family)
MSDPGPRRMGREMGRADLLPPALLDRLGGLELVARAAVHGFVAGLHRAPYRGSGREFAGHRAYQQGDDVRHIDWRLFGRSNRLYVREFREDANLQAYIVIDATASMEFADPHGITKLRYSQILAAALAHIMLSAGDAVGLASFSDRARSHLPPRSRRGHMHELLLELERLRSSGAAGAAETLERVGNALRRRSRVVLISDLLDHDDSASMLTALGRLRARGDEVIVIRPLTETEKGTVRAGARRFFDPEWPQRETAAAPAADGGYAGRVATYYDELARRLRERGIEYVPLSTADPLETALREWLAARRIAA